MYNISIERKGIDMKCKECGNDLGTNDVSLGRDTCYPCRRELANKPKIEAKRQGVVSLIEDNGDEIVSIVHNSKRGGFNCKLICGNCGEERSTDSKRLLAGSQCKCTANVNPSTQDLIDQLDTTELGYTRCQEHDVMGIYKISIGEEFYIGSSENIATRMVRHFSDMKRKKHQLKMLRALAEYGTDSVEIEVVEAVTDRDTLVEREQYWIDMLAPTLNIAKVANNTKRTAENQFAQFARKYGMCSSKEDAKLGKILDRLAYTRNLQEVASEFEVSYDVVAGITSGKGYTWLEEVYPVRYRKVMLLANSELAYEQLVSVLSELVKGTMQEEIAREYGVSVDTVSKIKTKKHTYCIRACEEDYIVKVLYEAVQERENQIGVL